MAAPPTCPECDYIPPDDPCDECGAGPGEKCRSTCTAPDGSGGPHEHHEPTTHDYENAPPLRPATGRTSNGNS